MSANKHDSDWKRVNRFRQEQKKLIATRKVVAPSLISANSEILRLAQQLQKSYEDSDASPDDKLEHTVF